MGSPSKNRGRGLGFGTGTGEGFGFLPTSTPDDTIAIWVLIVVSFALGARFRADLDNRPFYDTLWMASQTLETAALLAQVTTARNFSVSYRDALYGKNSVADSVEVEDKKAEKT